MEAQTKRIEFIDLAKGVCIILVILNHIGVDVNLPGTVSMRMPFYFMLSGLFFKDYGSFKNLLIKKINKLIIPLLFFYLLGYAIYYAVICIFPDSHIYSSYSILDIFTGRLYFNGPIWFLLSLFWCNVIFCVISVNVKKEIYRGIIVLAVGIAGFLLGKARIMLPMVLDVSLIALPFFYLGYILKRTPMLYPNKLDKYNLLFAVGFYALAVAIQMLCDGPRIWFHFNVFYGNPLLAVLISVVSVFAILFLCKAIKKLPFISYFGRYSIIPLCLHHLIYRHLELCVAHIECVPAQYHKYIVAAFTLLLCWGLIPLCISKLPHLTAQKDLIHI